MGRATRFAIGVLVLCAVALCSTMTGTLLAFLRADVSAKISQRTLTFEERVTYQRAIEEVYWRHRIWPKENAFPKPSLDAVMSQAQLEKKVADYLHKSQALGAYWQGPITAEQLQAEIDRMAQNTRQPEVLQELFDALGDDPFVIAECLARPSLAERLITSLYTYDQRIHGKLKWRVEAELQMHNAVGQMKQLSGKHSELELVRSDNGQGKPNRGVGHNVELESHEWDETIQKLAATFNSIEGNRANTRRCSHAAALPSLQEQQNRGASTQRGGYNSSVHTKNTVAEAYEGIPVGVASQLQEDETCYYATTILSKTADRLKLATVSWPKEPLGSWIVKVEIQAPTAIAALGGTYRLPKISGGSCVEDTWTATPGPPDARGSHTAVWDRQ